jgi:hypothetical protein
MSIVAGKSLRGSASESTVSVLNAVGSVANGVATVVNAVSSSAELLQMYVDTTVVNYRKTCALEVMAHGDRILDTYINDEVERLAAAADANGLPFDRHAVGLAVTAKYEQALAGL